MTTTVQIPVAWGGTNVAYNDGTGAYGMNSNNGYGHVTYLLPMLSEVMAAIAYMLTTSDASADAAAVSQVAAAASASGASTSATAAAASEAATRALFNRLYLGGF